MYLIVTLLFGLNAFILAHSKLIQRGFSNHNLRRDYALGARITGEELFHEVMISIKQNNQDMLKSFVDDVSNINSVNYGKYLSFREVGELVQNPTSTAAVISWLLENNVEITDNTEYGEYIYARSTVTNLEKLFNAEFYEFNRVVKSDEQSSVAKTIIRAVSYSLPEHLVDHIQSVHKLIDLPPVFVESSVIRPLKVKEISKSVVSDKVSRELANPLQPVNSNFPPTSVTPSLLSTMYSIAGMASL